MAEKEHVMHLGMNDNIKMGDTTFHVQTEDSGINNPFITSHVFIGGNILATKKTSYEDIVRSPNLNEIVRAIMDEQHKKIIVAIKRGKIDKSGVVNKPTAETKAQASGQAPAAAAAPETPPPVEQSEGGLSLGSSDKTFDEIIMENLSLDKK